MILSLRACHQLSHHVNGGYYFGVQCHHKPKLNFQMSLLFVVSVYLTQIPNHVQNLELSEGEFCHHLEYCYVTASIMLVKQFFLFLWECNQFLSIQSWHVMMCCYLWKGTVFEAVGCSKFWWMILHLISVVAPILWAKSGVFPREKQYLKLG